MMRGIFKRLLLVAFALLILVPYSYGSAAKSGQEGATLSPPIKEVNLKPGESRDYTIKINNPTDQIVTLYPSVVNFKASGEGGEPAFYDDTEESSQYSMSKWITYTQPVVALTTDQIVEWNYTISVPDNAEPGGHYGTIFFGTQPPNSTEGNSQVLVSSKVGCLVFVTVAGDFTEGASLLEYTYNKTKDWFYWFFFNPPVDLKTRITNEGNIHVKPQGQISIKKWGNTEVASLPVNEAGGVILPKSVRAFTTTWKPDYKYFFEIPFGRYTADLTLNYGIKDVQTINGSVTFWIIPIWFWIAVLVLLLLVVLIWLRFQFRKSKKRKQKAEKEMKDIDTRKDKKDTNKRGKKFWDFS